LAALAFSTSGEILESTLVVLTLYCEQSFCTLALAASMTPPPQPTPMAQSAAHAAVD